MKKISPPQIRRQNDDLGENLIVSLGQFEIEILLFKLLSEFKSVVFV